MDSVYRRLGSDIASRRVAYSSLLRGVLGPGELERVRAGTESGTDRFREQIEKVLDCRMLPLGHGGYRGSHSFRDQQL